MTDSSTTDRDRLYFRQLLAGRDFARDDPIARQMVNFVYLIGDRETGEAVAVDPAYGVGELVDSSPPTACASPACSPRTTTPTTSAATSWATRSRASASCSRIDDVAVAGARAATDEAEWVKRSTGVSDSDLVAPRQRRHGDGRARSRSR